MGNAESSDGGAQDPQTILDQFTTIKKFQDERYGDSTLMENKETKQQFIMREVNSTDEFDHKKGLEKFQNRLQLQHPNTVRLIKCFNKTDSQFCSTFYKTYLIFEFVNNSLEKEIIQRKPQQAYFSEGEIWNTMGGAIQGLAFQQRNNISHNTIKTGTIYLSEDGQPKVTDTTIFLQLNNFATVLQDKDSVQENIYLSPILMQSLQDNNWNPVHNEFKSDVFSFGMTLLSMGLLQYCNDCYDYSEGQFHMQQLESKLFTFSQRYSQDLTQFIMLMLKQDEETRMDFIQLEEILIQQPGSQQQLPQENQQQHQQLPQNEASQHQYSQQEQVEQVKHAQHKQQSPLQDMQEMFQDKQQQIPTNTQQSQQLKQQIQQSPPQIQQQNQGPNTNSQQKFNQASPQIPQVNQFQQQQQQQKLQTKPAVGMAREEPDQGTTNNFAPKDFCSEIPKPDENQGNDLGRETYREDVDQGASYPEDQNQDQQQYQNQDNSNLPVENYNNYQQNNQYNNQDQQHYQVQQQEQQQPEKQNPHQEHIPSSASMDYQQSKNQQNYQFQPTYQQPSYQQNDYKHYEGSYKPYEPEEKPKHTAYQQESYKPPSQFVENIPAPPIQPINKSNEKKQEPATQNSQHTSNIDDILKKYGAQSNYQNYKPPTTISNNNYNSNSANTEKVQQQQTSYQVPSYQGYQPANQEQQYNKLSEQFNTHGKISDSKQESKPSESTNKSTVNNNPYSNNSNNPYSASKNSNTVQQSYTPYSNYQQPTNSYGQQYQQPQKQQNEQINNQHQSYQNNYSQQSQKEFVIENYQNGSKYEGEKQNQMRHGKGKFYYQDNGGLYDGNWSYNKMHGKGILYYGSGKPAYDGDWVEDKFEGFGVLFNENPVSLQTPFDYTDFDQVDEFWTKYDGQFKDDNKEGYGTLYLSNGEKFQGTFKADFVEGAGTYYTISGQIISGIWNNNKFQPNQ